MKVALISIIVIIAVCIIVYAYYGGFTRIHIHTEKQGGETVVYENMIGDYKNSSTLMDSIYYTLLNEYKIYTFKGFGTYYDNPQKVEKSKLRSQVGCIIEPNDVDTAIARITKFNHKTLPIQQYIVCEFPFKGSLSIIISLIKVYPALHKYAVEHNYSLDGEVTEIYDIPRGKIFYRKTINQ